MTTTPSKADAEMIEGYLDGRSDQRLDYPESLSNRGHSYKHGWLNGRDDRINQPRDTYRNLLSASVEAQLKDNAV